MWATRGGHLIPIDFGSYEQRSTVRLEQYLNLCISVSFSELLLQNLEDVPSMKNPEPRGSKRKRSNFTRPPTSSISATDTCSCSESDQQSFSDQPCSSQSLSSWQHGVKRTYESAFSG